MTVRKRIAICLDGTWQNPYQEKERDDGTSVLKPSNVLKLSRAILPRDPTDGTPQITYYDSGIGGLVTYPGMANRWLSGADRLLGGGWGAGFECNVEEAFRFLVHNYTEGDQVFVFGFSRGAAQARALTTFLSWLGGIPGKRDAYFAPLFFLDFVTTRGTGRPDEVTTAGGDPPSGPLVPITVEMLGVWDTVMALGSRLRATGRTSSAGRTFYVPDTPAGCVSHARQALAIDERRYDFRPEIWRAAALHQTLEQRWFAGSHSNIGGGYVHDGLANITFRWLLNEAAGLGLVIDREFIKPYRPFCQDQYYSSGSAMYTILDTVRFRRGKGRRTLIGQPATANLYLDKSVIHRIRSDPDDARFTRLELYRPDNVLELLAEQPDITQYLVGLGVSPDDTELPADVTERIRQLR
jgi:uncharacterized protein (DUF2235 family)